MQFKDVVVRRSLTGTAYGDGLKKDLGVSENKGMEVDKTPGLLVRIWGRIEPRRTYQ